MFGYAVRYSTRDRKIQKLRREKGFTQARLRAPKSTERERRCTVKFSITSLVQARRAEEAQENYERCFLSLML